MASNDGAQRRLAYLLSDENYGPKLARLRGDNERSVLRLIEQNRGKEAREAILQFDEARRERARGQRQQRRNSREQQESDAVANILRIYGTKANAARVRKNVGYMTPNELQFAGSAEEDDLTDRATEPAYTQNKAGKDINPFWYH